MSGQRTDGKRKMMRPAGAHRALGTQDAGGTPNVQHITYRLTIGR